ncbi:hypothetical protein [Freshwater macrophyte associated wei-like virus 1]|nr:hypothetical protein [Freshwater macrophyte associated wei-like virus 1]
MQLFRAVFQTTFFLSQRLAPSFSVFGAMAGRNKAAKKQQPSKQELARRRKQSAKDKAAPARPKPKARPARQLAVRVKRPATSTLGGYVASLKRGIHAHFKTRVDIVRGYNRCTMPQAFPHLLFHPSRSPSALLVVTRNSALAPTYTGRGGEENVVFPNFVGDMLGTHSITDSAPYHAELLGSPNTFPGHRCVCLGGAARFTIMCGPTVRGEIVWDTLGVPPPDPMTAAADLISDPRAKRMELRPGRNVLCIRGAINSKPALEIWDELNEQFNWGVDDAWCGTMVVVNGLVWGDTDTAPTMTIETWHAIQTALEPNAHHLLTNHPIVTGDQIARQHAETSSDLVEAGATGALLAQYGPKAAAQAGALGRGMLTRIGGALRGAGSAATAAMAEAEAAVPLLEYAPFML